jgi:hypothetical protein
VVDTELRLPSPADRAAFSQELTKAIVQVAAVEVV